MPQRNSVSWNVMITAYVRGREIVEALELFREMKARGEYCTVITIVVVLSGCADIGALDLGKCIHGNVSKSNLGFGVTVNPALMDMYAKVDVLIWKECREVFVDMIELKMKPKRLHSCQFYQLVVMQGYLLRVRVCSMDEQFYGLQPKIEHYGSWWIFLAELGF
ncbi:putative pentatricopeptide repeat-containing protein At5g59200, chloroplastic [Pistacia vera]|uniref:putative pentatricopeptide repeat-containing protein At5g59200, chloroplastic n=1 Tax=Pistacia vera TaxID=55513 RepID=UPI001263DAD2|nr:putative pentatricopeptide repeat-containing protein At5g59200, chloroplastic [Pistacia vera]